jgi:hypothetical protein
MAGGSGVMSAGRRSGRALLALSRIGAAPTVMPRSWHGGTGRFGDENWADQIGEHSAGGPARL